MPFILEKPGKVLEIW